MDTQCVVWYSNYSKKKGGGSLFFNFYLSNLTQNSSLSRLRSRMEYGNGGRDHASDRCRAEPSRAGRCRLPMRWCLLKHNAKFWKTYYPKIKRKGKGKDGARRNRKMKNWISGEVRGFGLSVFRFPFLFPFHISVPDSSIQGNNLNQIFYLVFQTLTFNSFRILNENMLNDVFCRYITIFLNIHHIIKS